MRLLRKLFRSEDNWTEEVAEPIRPARRLYVVGDIHGCDALLSRLLTRIEQHMSVYPDPQAVTILVGDYVDRGENSAAVLNRVFALDNDSENVVCLMGNHERMMLDFIEDPAGAGPRWLRHGGMQTLASFGIGGVSDSSDAGAMMQAAGTLAEALGRELLAWLHALPLDWTSGNVVVTHAALDPDMPPTVQSDRCKLWGHPDFMQKARRDGIWVAHGHVVVDMPTASQSRISVDTGAVFTGRLTAAVLNPSGEPEFLQA